MCENYAKTLVTVIMKHPVDEAGYLPGWAGATSLKKDFPKTQRKIVEAAFIATEDTLNIPQGFFSLASVAATLIRSEYNEFAQ